MLQSSYLHRTLFLNLSINLVVILTYFTLKFCFNHLNIKVITTASSDPTGYFEVTLLVTTSSTEMVNFLVSFQSLNNKRLAV